MLNGDESFEFICPSFYTHCDSTAIHMFNLKETLHNVYSTLAEYRQSREKVLGKEREWGGGTHTHNDIVTIYVAFTLL